MFETYITHGLRKYLCFYIYKTKTSLFFVPKKEYIAKKGKTFVKGHSGTVVTLRRSPW